MVGMDLFRHLRSWSADELTRLLQSRPDLLPASDHGVDALARKAASATSLGRALVNADVGMLVVAEALVASHPATVDEIDELLGAGDPIGVVEAVERLHRLAVVTEVDGLIQPVGALPDLLHRPLGLGPSFTELADALPADTLDKLAADTAAAGGRRSPTVRAIARRLRDPAVVEALLASAPDGTAELLGELSAQRSPAIALPAGHAYRDPLPDDPLGWLLQRGLVIAVADRGAELPRELAMAAHPAGLAPGASLRPIELEPVPGIDADVVAALGADTANRTLEAIELLLGRAQRREISVRRAGGIGPREIGRLAKACGLPAISVARLLELAVAARLIEVVDGAAQTTALADRWWSLPRWRRHLALVRAWMSADHFLSRGLSGEGAKQPVALGGAEPVAAAASARTIAIATMATTPPGQAWEPNQLAAAVVWQAPNLWGTGRPSPEELMAWTTEEAELLGLVAEQAPTPVLRALQADGQDDGQSDLDRACAAAVGDDQATLVLQNDLTALSLGPLAPSLSRPLADMAERDADAETPTWRFTESSIRRALDDGWTAETIEGFLTDHALAGVPQPLAYLIADVDRRHGSVRVMGAASVILTDDEVGAVEVASHRRASALGLRLVAPTVLLSPLDPVAVAEGLRAAGFLPVLHGGTVTVAGSRSTSSGDGDDSLDRAGETDGSGSVADLPADWTGPAIPAGPLAAEVADAVTALLDQAESDAGPIGQQGAERPSRLDELAAAWGRPVRLTTATAEGTGDVTGVVVGLGQTVSLLTTDGVVEIPSASVIDATRPDRV